MDERERLALRYRGVRLAPAVAAAEVALGDEDHDERRRVDVVLESVNRFEIVDVEEDGDGGQQQAELPLDRRALVL